MQVLAPRHGTPPLLLSNFHLTQNGNRHFTLIFRGAVIFSPQKKGNIQSTYRPTSTSARLDDTAPTAGFGRVCPSPFAASSAARKRNSASSDFFITDRTSVVFDMFSSPHFTETCCADCICSHP